MDQAFRDRFQIILDVELPSKEERFNRVSLITGCKERPFIDKAIDIVENIQQVMAAKNIQDGVCGMRKLIDWVNLYNIIGDKRKAAVMTAINGATDDPEAKELLMACLDAI